MEGNALCKQIPWDNNPEFLAAWKESRTGYPFIDAIMTQLRTEGWIHHLARHAVACFLTRGDLWQSWEAGAKRGNRSGQTFHRCYSPVAFGKKTDPTGAYIRKYMPQLRKYPDKYIYEPWTAPLSVQKAANCVIGTDYPAPIVDHKEVSKENMARMKEAYAANKDTAAGADIGNNNSDSEHDAVGSSSSSSSSKAKSTLKKRKQPAAAVADKQDFFKPKKGKGSS
eukprot:13091-Heterococcus_DN1.PRE.1